MARIAGVQLPTEKRIEVALTYIKGIGLATSKKILEKAKVDINSRTKDISEKDITAIQRIIDSEFKVEGELTQTVFRDIKRLKDIKCYRGVRHSLGLPVRGQKTRSNAVTRKGKNIAVGGLKRTIDKK